MNQQTIGLVETELKSCLSRKTDQQPVFDLFLNACRKFYQAPAHNMVELRQRSNTKLRGDIFEHFCYLYLTRVYGLDTVWFLADVPDPILEKLCLKRHDLGIDLVGFHKDRYYAIQCKYRDRETINKAHKGLGWKQLSTFYALVNRTGPFFKHIVMTNMDYVRHVGRKTPKDLSFCYQRYRELSWQKWMLMVPHKLAKPIIKLKTQKGHMTELERMRASRLEYFKKFLISENPSNP